MINCKLRLFTPRSSHGAKEMAPKSQLCACSFQYSLWQKNWALEQIREFPDKFGYVWTAENDSNTLRVGAKIFVSAKKCLRKKNFRIRVDMALMARTMAVHVRFNSWYISLTSSAKQQREMIKSCVVWRT